MEALIEYLPSIIWQLVYGYLFYTTYRYARYQEEKIELNNLLIISFVIGFVISELALLIPINTSFDFIGIMGLSIVTGTFVGKILNSKVMSCISQKLGIFQTPNSIWIDLYDTDKAFDLRIFTNDGRVIEGAAHFLSPQGDTFSVVGYTVKDAIGNIVIDKQKDNTVAMVIEKQNILMIEYIYDKESSMCEKIEQRFPEDKM